MKFLLQVTEEFFHILELVLCFLFFFFFVFSCILLTAVTMNILNYFSDNSAVSYVLSIIGKELRSSEGVGYFLQFLGGLL